MNTSRRKFLTKSVAASAAGFLLPLNSMSAMDYSQSEFSTRQQAQRTKLFSLLGDLPVGHKPKAPKLIRKEQHTGYTLEYLEFDFNGLESVPGILLVPDKRQKRHRVCCTAMPTLVPIQSAKMNCSTVEV